MTGLKRSLLLVFTVSCLVLTSSTMYGYAALKPMLIEEKVYFDLCENVTVGSCDEQILQLDLMYTLATSLFSGFMLIGGIILDHYGPRFAVCLGEFLVCSGSILLALSSSTLNLYFVGYLLTSIGNPVI